MASVLLLGIAKGGFGGVGTPIALPIMALGIPTELALGALLPLLIAMDIVSVGSHHGNADKKAVLYALPASLVGVVLGASLIAIISADVTGFVIGVLSIIFAFIALSGYTPQIAAWPTWTGSIFGACSGFTSTIAHAGGPPIHIYYLSRGYDHRQFVATSAMFMAGVNLLKVVPFLVVGALDRSALLLSLYLAPLALGAAYLGVLLSRRISRTIFKFAVNGLLLLVGCKLIFDAVT
ncbi:MAG: sulfite exporter TauE/SafE family protein [Pseudomonadota bacterium]